MVTRMARVWPFVLVLGVRVSNMLVSGYGFFIFYFFILFFRFKGL